MDDATIVRTLAEFEGYRRQSYIEAGWGIVIKWYDANGDEVLGDEYSPPGQGGLPEYLTDYNSVARVWKQAHQTPRCGIYGEARNQLKIDTWNGWFNQTPREHARALATAIAKHKESTK